MRSLRNNSLSNLIGKLWVAIASFAFTPIYIKLLGVEAYGLVGIYTSLIALLSILDLGLSSTLSKELPRLEVNSETSCDARNLIRTLEVIYWSLTILLILIAIFVAPVYIPDWINASSTKTNDLKLESSLIIMAVAVRLPMLLYFGGLQGLQKQVFLNYTVVIAETARAIGCVILLSQIGGDIRIFIGWQLIINFTHTLSTSFLLWRCLPTIPKGKGHALFKLNLLKRVWQFSSAMTLFVISGTCIQQLDKLLLSKLIPLQEFGYYSLAITLGCLPHFLVMAPIYFAIFPYFSRLIAQTNCSDLVKEYHAITQASVVAVVPLGFFLSLFSHDVLTLWMRDSHIANQTSQTVTYFAFAMTIHALVHIPYAFQFASGWVSLAVRYNLILALCSIPSLWVLTKYFGAVGGGINWILVNFVYLFLLVPEMHKKLLIGELKEWYLQDLAKPSLIIFLVLGLLKLIQPQDLSDFILFAWMAFSLFAATVAGLFSLPVIKFKLFSLLKPNN
jgi:O-antigen/teichoic acid export membrane protein